MLSGHSAGICFARVLLAACTLACGSEPAREDAGSPDAQTGRAPAAALCRRPNELDTVLAPSVLAGSSEAVQIAVTASGTWIAQSDRLYRVPVGSRVAEPIYQAPPAERVHGLRARGDGVVVMTDSEFIAFDTAGQQRSLASLMRGADIDLLSLWPVAFSAARAVTPVLAAGGQLALASIDLSTGAVKTLAAIAQLPERLAFADDGTVFWTEANDDPATPYYARVASLDLTSGALVELSVDLGVYPLDFSLLDADADAVFIDVGLTPTREPTDASAFDIPGVYRVARDGGSAQKIVSVSALAFDIFGLFGAGDSSEAVPADGAELVRVGSVGDATLYRARPGVAAERLLCLDLEEGWVARTAYYDNALYLVLVDGSEVSVVRHAF